MTFYEFIFSSTWKKMNILNTLYPDRYELFGPSTRGEAFR